ncbi:MAG: hypothetical protein LBI17_00125 [Rickettsiales bacterium]|jgi:tetratricopeptide (TPR) repeat protein|nr:hypothetical protein [Rickettsiales bacterium]
MAYIVFVLGLPRLWRWNPAFFGGCVVLLAIGMSIVLMWIFQWHFMRGMRYMKRNEYERAIVEFEKNLNFLSMHRYLDRFRMLFMLNASKLPLRELTMYNIGSCNSYMGRTPQALKYYRTILNENPKNYLAVAVLEVYEVNNKPIKIAKS